MSPPPYRHLKERTEQGVLVLTLTDAQIRGDQLAEELAHELHDAIARTAAPRVVLDLGGVAFLSTVAFRPLLFVHKQVKDLGGRVVLCGLQPAVAEVLHLTRLLSSSRTYQAPFEEQPDMAAAVVSLSKQVVGGS